ncbi:hypothetical protein F2Q70_00012352 [Brassica cretica]|uniref:Uncharacterized protein n=1 Tax=Brassica cretica TaxID=69181 RepID=A0A8S9LZY6_BRACR|nr:hypothetical protein F2Q70_00012352 [Brassica cretica]
MSTSAGGNKSPGDATPLAESAMVPVQVLEVSAQPSGSSTTPVPAPKEKKATELMPPPLDRKEIVLGLPASSAAPLTKSRKRTGAATETVKKRRCTAGAEGEPSGPLSQHRAKNREESRTVVSRDDFHARLTRMAVLFDSLMVVHEKDLALASVEGSLNEIHLLKGDMVPTLDSEEARLLSRKEELKASDEDFDLILSQLQFECTLTPHSGKTKGHAAFGKDQGARPRG